MISNKYAWVKNPPKPSSSASSRSQTPDELDNPDNNNFIVSVEEPNKSLGEFEPGEITDDDDEPTPNSDSKRVVSIVSKHPPIVFSEAKSDISPKDISIKTRNDRSMSPPRASVRRRETDRYRSPPRDRIHETSRDRSMRSRERNSRRHDSPRTYRSPDRSLRRHELPYYLDEPLRGGELLAGRASEKTVFECLSRVFDFVSSNRQFQSEQRIVELIRLVKQNLERLKVDSSEWRTYLETYLGRLIKEKSWNCMTVSQALCVSVTWADRSDPRDVDQWCVVCDDVVKRNMEQHMSDFHGYPMSDKTPRVVDRNQPAWIPQPPIKEAPRAMQDPFQLNPLDLEAARQAIQLLERSESDEAVEWFDYREPPSEPKWSTCNLCRLEVPPQGYACTKCDQTFSYRVQLFIHVRDAHKLSVKLPMKCEMCESAFSSLDVALVHILKEAHPCVSEHLQCAYGCQRLFHDLQSLGTHNDQEHEFHCEYCDTIVVVPDKRQHFEKEHPDKPMKTQIELTLPPGVERNSKDGPHVVLSLIPTMGSVQNQGCLVLSNDRVATFPKHLMPKKFPAKEIRWKNKADLIECGFVYCSHCTLVYNPILPHCEICNVVFANHSHFYAHVSINHKKLKFGEAVGARNFFPGGKQCSEYLTLITCVSEQYCECHWECPKGCKELIVGGKRDLQEHVNRVHGTQNHSNLQAPPMKYEAKAMRRDVPPASGPFPPRQPVANSTHMGDTAPAKTTPATGLLSTCSVCYFRCPSDLILNCDKCEAENNGKGPRMVDQDELMMHISERHNVFVRGDLFCQWCPENQRHFFKDDISGLLAHRASAHGFCQTHERCPNPSCDSILSSGSPAAKDHLQNECKFRPNAAPAPMPPGGQMPPFPLPFPAFAPPPILPPPALPMPFMPPMNQRPPGPSSTNPRPAMPPRNQRPPAPFQPRQAPPRFHPRAPPRMPYPNHQRPTRPPNPGPTMRPDTRPPNPGPQTRPDVRPPIRPDVRPPIRPDVRPSVMPDTTPQNPVDASKPRVVRQIVPHQGDPVSNPRWRLCRSCPLTAFISKKYVCSYCSTQQNFWLEDEYVAHLVISHHHETSREFSCAPCDLKFSDAVKFDKHFKSHVFCPNHLLCPTEGCVWLAPDSAQIESHISKKECSLHISVDSVNNSKVCNRCKAMFSVGIVYCCPVCRLKPSFLSLYEYLTHIETSHSRQIVGSFACPDCSTSVASPSLLQAHMLGIHNRCSSHKFCRNSFNCPTVFPGDDNDMSHMCNHTDDKSESSQLVIPRGVTSRPRVFKCDTCPFSAQDIEAQRCSVCRAAFITRSELCAHMSMVHNVSVVGQFICSFCPKGLYKEFTNNPKQLLDHLSQKHNHCQFHQKCSNSVCDKLFPWTKDIIEHETLCKAKTEILNRKKALGKPGFKKPPFPPAAPIVPLSVKTPEVVKPTPPVPEFPKHTEPGSVYLCDKCNYSTERQPAPSAHCDECNLRFYSRFERDAHRVLVHDEPLPPIANCLNCDLCDFNTMSPVTFVNHRRRDHGLCEMHLLCKDLNCTQLVPSVEELQMHIVDKKCRRTTGAPGGKQTSTFLHVKNEAVSPKKEPPSAPQVEDEKVLSCTSCALKVTCSEESQVWGCNECKKNVYFINRFELEAHRQERHRAPLPQEAFECDMCSSFKPSDLTFLLTHREKVHGFCQQHFLCSVAFCRVLLSSLDELYKHEVACDTSKGFPGRVSLRNKQQEVSGSKSSAMSRLGGNKRPAKKTRKKAPNKKPKVEPNPGIKSIDSPGVEPVQSSSIEPIDSSGIEPIDSPESQFDQDENLEAAPQNDSEVIGVQNQDHSSDPLDNILRIDEAETSSSQAQRPPPAEDSKAKNAGEKWDDMMNDMLKFSEDVLNDEKNNS